MCIACTYAYASKRGTSIAAGPVRRSLTPTIGTRFPNEVLIVQQTTIAVAITLAVVAAILIIILVWPLGRVPLP